MINVDRQMELSAIFGLLSDPVRRRILLGIETGEKNVTGLCRLVGMRQQAVSHHLALMRLRGLVAVHRRGKCNFYQLAERGQEAVALMRHAGAA